MRVAFLFLLFLPFKAQGGDLMFLESLALAFPEVIRGELPREVSLSVRIDVLNPRTNAEILLQGTELMINVMGGMIRHPRLTPETLQLLLCHETGHFLGGPPFKSRTGWSSTEGQSDYFSALKCAKLVGMDEQSFIDAALSLTAIYAEVSREAPPRLESCDEKKVPRTNFGYPGAQCRLDTLIAGWSGGERPRCWYFHD